MIPLYDHNPTETTPFVTIALIAANIGAFTWQATLPSQMAEHAVDALGVVPALWTGHYNVEPPFLSFFSCMFLHGGAMHLAGNMLFLWIFGNNVEDALGHGKYLFFYLVTGICASVTHVVFNPLSTVPVIGASGAISGVLGAYFLYYPRVRVVGIIPIIPIFFMPRIELPAFLFLGFYFVMQVMYGLSAAASQVGGVAWWAHIGGFGAGFFLAGVLRRRR